MVGTKFASLVRFYTRSNSTTFSDADIVLIANVVKDDFAKEIIKADEDYFGVPETTDLRATSDSDFTLREYPLPTDDMKVIRVEGKLDGTNWTKLIKFDLTQWTRPTTEAEVIDHFTNSYGGAYWDKFRNAIWLYTGSIASAVSNGLKIHHIAYPSDINTGTLADASTDLSEDPTTTTSGMPRQFHELWARQIAIIYKSSKEKPIPLSERELTFERDFKKAIASIENIDSEGTYGQLPDDSDLQ